MFSSPCVREVTSGWNAGSVAIIGGGGGSSSSGIVPGGFGRSVDWAAVPSAAAVANAAMAASAVRRWNRAANMGGLDSGAKCISLERELRLAFGRAGLESARLIVLEDRLDHGLRVVDHAQELRIVHADHALFLERRLDPREEPAPEGAAHENHRELADLAGLHQREDLHQLVQR